MELPCISMMKIIHSFFLLVGIPAVSFSQKLPEDWDNYYISSKGKPVSIVVNLALQKISPVKLKPFALIFRTKINETNDDGLPTIPEQEHLEQLENKLEMELAKNLGAVYVGRFTQRGIRECYFYSGDTSSFQQNIKDVMKIFPQYSWLAKATLDPDWSHYLNVLYPSVYDLEKIENRRMIETLKNKGDALETPRPIEHSFRFRSISSRNEFLKSLSLNDFKITYMPKDKIDDELFPFHLIISRTDTPQQIKMDQLTLTLLKEALKVNGRYDGWKTGIVK